MSTTPRGIAEKPCLFCGTPFKYQRTAPWRKYCGWKCCKEDQRIRGYASKLRETPYGNAQPVRVPEAAAAPDG